MRLENQEEEFECQLCPCFWTFSASRLIKIITSPLLPNLHLLQGIGQTKLPQLILGQSSQLLCRQGSMQVKTFHWEKKKHSPHGAWLGLLAHASQWHKCHCGHTVRSSHVQLSKKSKGSCGDFHHDTLRLPLRCCAFLGWCFWTSHDKWCFRMITSTWWKGDCGLRTSSPLKWRREPQKPLDSGWSMRHLLWIPQQPPWRAESMALDFHNLLHHQHAQATAWHEWRKLRGT